MTFMIPPCWGGLRRSCAVRSRRDSAAEAPIYRLFDRCRYLHRNPEEYIIDFIRLTDHEDTPMRQVFFLGLFVFGVFFFIVSDSLAQPPEGFRGRRPGGGRLGGSFRMGQSPSQTIIGVPSVPDSVRPQPADTTLGIGTVPALWELSPSSLNDDDLMSIEDQDSIAPPVAAKVVRFAIHFLAQHDANGDGVLQKEEWTNLPGAPQAIDIDGDGTITLDELIRSLAVYGAKRTIHRPNPVETFYQPKVVSSQLQLFRPLTAPPASTSPTPTPTPDGTPTDDMTEERVADDTMFEDTTYEDIVADALPPTEKRYYTAPEALRGVPRWFIVLDRDGDGQVSLAEFAPNMSPTSLALFGRLDKNGDGFITPDEVRKEETPKKEEPSKQMQAETTASESSVPSSNPEIPPSPSP